MPGETDVSRPSGKRLASFDRPTAADAVSIAVVSDPHVSTRAEGTARLFHLTRDHLSNAVRDINERDPDFTLFTGDLTKSGGPWDFDAFDDVVADLERPYAAVPGNHDVPKAHNDHDVLPLDEFERRYTPGGLPFVASVGDLDLVCLDSEGSVSGLEASHDGRVSADQIAWLDETLPKLTTPVVALHHNLPGTTAQIEAYLQSELNREIPNRLRDPEPLLEVLEANDVPLALTGHRHVPGVAETGSVREIMAPTTCTFPQGYVYLEVGPDGTTADFVPVADYDGMREAMTARFDGSDIPRTYARLAALRLAAPGELADRSPVSRSSRVDSP